MPREYRQISRYAEEINELREEGYNLNEIGKKLGFSHQQVRNYVHRENRKQRKVVAGIVVKGKGRPQKEKVESKTDEITELKNILVCKEAKIKSLEMENELMRDFLSLIERK